MSLVDDTIYEIKEGKYIRNVHGSTDDTCPPGYSDWISVWKTLVKEKTGKEPSKYCCVCKGTESTRRKIIGGHVVLGDPNRDFRKGAATSDKESLWNGDRVFIAPICNICNTKSKTLKVRYSAPIIHLLYFGYNETWDAYESKDGTIEGNWGNDIRTCDGKRAEWESARENYHGTIDDNDSEYFDSPVLAATSDESDSSESSSTSLASERRRASTSASNAGYRFGYGKRAFVWGKR